MEDEYRIVINMEEDKVQTIRERMQNILKDCEGRNPAIDNTYKQNTQKSTISEKDTSIPWLLEEWRRISIPDWRRTLQKSIELKDKKREEYARWMLREVLEDPDYKENEL